MNIKDAIIQSVPGTGREIADKINVMDIPNAKMVTPNVVYQVMAKYGKENNIKRFIINRPTGFRGAMQKVSYFCKMNCK